VTEAEWLAATDPAPMLEFLRDQGAASGIFSCGCCRVHCVRVHRRQRVRVHCPSYRKLRLFASACCQRILHLLPHVVCRTAAESLERYIERGAVHQTSYRRAVDEFDRVRRARYPSMSPPNDDAWTALYCAVHRYWDHGSREEDFRVERRWDVPRRVAELASGDAGPGEPLAQCRLIRDIFRGPVRAASALAPDCLSWNGGTVPKLAESVYAERAFDRLPLLADALEDAGCSDPDLLGHLRGRGPHVRGCWAVDLLLEKG
jgi:hypothetical protein